MTTHAHLQSAAMPNGALKRLDLGALDAARNVLAIEARAIEALGRRLDETFCAVKDLLLCTQGQVVVTGVGKSGHIGQKISATLASTSTPSFFLHAAEAVHGDLGRMRAEDVLLALSNSGESHEVLGMLEHTRRLKIPLVAITGNAKSSLGRAADYCLDIGAQQEACPLGLAPTTSTTVMLALGDALAMTVLQERPDRAQSYAERHPGGALGRRTRYVREIMRSGAAMPIVNTDSSLKSALEVMSQTLGRPGAAIVVDEAHKIAGLFTDGDLRRLVERGAAHLGCPMSEVMQPSPKVIRPDLRVFEAEALLEANQVDQVPVVDEAGRPVGLLDVQDLLSIRP